MKNTLLLVVLLMGLTGILGCSTVQVSQDYRASADFSNLKTYLWTTHDERSSPETWEDDPFVSERVQKAVNHYLYMKGYQREAGTEPDFFIDYQYNVNRIVEVRDTHSTVGVGYWGWRPGFFGGVGVGTTPYYYTRREAVLHIDIMDPETGTILWRGKGTHRLGEHWGPETKTEKINELVGKILEQFPPNG